MRDLPRSLTVRPVRLQGRLEETRYKKSDDGLHYRHESDADLWLVETRDGRRATLAMPRRGQGWTRDGGTTWLTNAPGSTSMAHKTKRSKRRPPPGGWKKYMASIRPNRGGGKKRMAKRVRKARKAVATRARPKVVLINRPRKRSGRRRNNPPVASLAGVLGTVIDGAIGGATIVATEVGTKLLRGRVLKMAPGQMLSGLTEVGISTTAGLLTKYFVRGRWGERLGQLMVDAGFASVTRAMLKQITVNGAKPKWVTDLLGNDARQNFVVRDGRVFAANDRMAGYVTGNARLNGYVPGARSAALGGYVRGNGMAEMAAVANMVNG